MARMSVWTTDGRRERGIRISPLRLSTLKIKRARQLDRLIAKAKPNKIRRLIARREFHRGGEEIV
jgi:hypothetical protein